MNEGSTSKKVGRPATGRVRDTKLNLRVEPKVKAHLKEIAEARNVSQSDLIEQLILSLK